MAASLAGGLVSSEQVSFFRRGAAAVGDDATRLRDLEEEERLGGTRPGVRLLRETRLGTGESAAERLEGEP